MLSKKLEVRKYNMRLFKKINSLIVVLFFVLCFFPVVIYADDAPTTVLEPSASTDCNNCAGTNLSDSCKKYCGNYQVSDVMSLGVRISNMILGVVGALALLAFVVGGIMFLVSAGNKSLVERGKNTIIGAVIGLIVVFASYTIISFTASVLGIKVEEKGIFNSGWFNK